MCQEEVKMCLEEVKETPEARFHHQEARVSLPKIVPLAFQKIKFRGKTKQISEIRKSRNPTKQSQPQQSQ